MSNLQEQLIALGGVFQAAVLVDRIARTGQASEANIGCMLGSLLVRDPKDTLEVFGGDDLNLRDGYRRWSAPWSATPAACNASHCAMPCRCWALERQLNKRGDLLDTIGNRLPQIQSQAEHFGLVHENVIASSGALYQDTLSTLRQRIQVHGDMRFLQQASNASKIRALLLAGIRAARLWRQLGGHRWQLVFSRRKLLNELYDMMRSPS
jgi:Uncharacterized protein involved in purine metabolism